jgi:spoIIIJ-associated protein
MEYVETEGDTIDEAIAEALKKLGVERDQITVEILAEGKKGLFGLGAKKARVRASLRKSLALDEGEGSARETPAQETKITEADVARVAQKGKEVLEEILRLMEIAATVEIKPGGAADEAVLDIRCDCGGLLIGRRGQTLEALQYLVTRIVSDRQGRDGPQLVVDTENYQERRRKGLEDMALRLGEKAKRQRKTVTVDPLDAADRRVVQAALQDDPWLTTKSLGMGAYRRMLIIPEGDRKRKEDDPPQPSEKPEPKGQK